MSKLKVLFIGDISGRAGRETIAKVLPNVKKKYKPDIVIANCENAAGGIGITKKVIMELKESGVDYFTGGDHTFRFSEFLEALEDPTLPFVISANYEASDLPGKRYEIIDMGKKGKLGLLSLLGQELMPGVQRVKSPFWYADEFFNTTLPSLETQPDLWFVDFHAETATEKLSLAWYLKDKIAAMVGTHTHVATADNRILGNSLAYVTDTGQVGPYQASLWVNFESTIHNFKYPNRKQFVLEENYPRIFNSVFVTFENYSPKSIDRVDIVVEGE